MKKFKYPLAITGPVEELRELTFDLGKLGYTLLNAYSEDKPFLLTGLSREDRIEFGEKIANRQIILNSSQKDLILALAAMVDGDKFYEGEWVVCRYYNVEPNLECIESISTEHLKGSGLRHTLLGHVLHLKGWSHQRCYPENYRKATKEEIIEHFNKKDMNVTQEPKKITLSSDFVKQAHAAACDDWKKRIEEELPELFPKVELTEKAKKFFENSVGKTYYDSIQYSWIKTLTNLTHEQLLARAAKKIDSDEGVRAIKIMNLIAEEWG